MRDRLFGIALLAGCKLSLDSLSAVGALPGGADCGLVLRIYLTDDLHGRIRLVLAHPDFGKGFPNGNLSASPKQRLSPHFGGDPLAFEHALEEMGFGRMPGGKDSCHVVPPTHGNNTLESRADTQLLSVPDFDKLFLAFVR